jgi:hypothetical protein
VILSNFRRTRTVPYCIVFYRTKFKPQRTVFIIKIQYREWNLLNIKNSLGTFGVPYFRTIIKNLDLFLKTRVCFKKYHKIIQNKHCFMVFFQKNPSF